MDDSEHDLKELLFNEFDIVNPSSEDYEFMEKLLLSYPDYYLYYGYFSPKELYYKLANGEINKIAIIKSQKKVYTSYGDSGIIDKISPPEIEYIATMITPDGYGVNFSYTPGEKEFNNTEFNRIIKVNPGKDTEDFHDNIRDIRSSLGAYNNSIINSISKYAKSNDISAIDIYDAYDLIIELRDSIIPEIISDKEMDDFLNIIDEIEMIKDHEVGDEEDWQS